jgi:hypothetical protein
MSVCDPNDPNACDSCRPIEGSDRAGRPLDANQNGRLDLFEPLTDEQRREYEDMETRLKALRLEARELKRSGNPAVKAEGAKSLAYIEDQLAWVRSELSKGGADA